MNSPSIDPLVAVEEFHAEAAFHHQEHLVFVLVVMEDELALRLYKFHHLAVELAGDVGLVVFRNFGELIGNVDFIHTIPQLSASHVQIRSEVSWLQETGAAIALTA